MLVVLQLAFVNTSFVSYIVPSNELADVDKAKYTLLVYHAVSLSDDILTKDHIDSVISDTDIVEKPSIDISENKKTIAEEVATEVAHEDNGMDLFAELDVTSNTEDLDELTVASDDDFVSAIEKELAWLE